MSTSSTKKNKKYICPNCGHELVFNAMTYALFQPDENGGIGKAILDHVGVAEIEDSVSENMEDISFWCPKCGSSYEVVDTTSEDPNTGLLKTTYEVGESFE